LLIQTAADSDNNGIMPSGQHVVWRLQSEGNDMDRQIEDGELVARVLCGDDSAFDILVGRYRCRLISVVSRLVKDHGEAEDVVQEAFVKAYRALPRFRGESQFYTWIYRIAINTAKNSLASAARRPHFSTIDLDGILPQVEGALFGSAPLSPEEFVRGGELASQAAQVMSTLPSELQDVITMREFEGLSYKEIAEEMACPVGTVRSRLFRARQTVEKKILPLLQ
jgi:RNA polymerase sigma-70 factor (ECF subfamily)|tara:strand:- start:1110 stop:1781 length:672 start_codon:yes stop_codon:yes gene_type:complete